LLHIRPAVPSDADAIAAVHAASWEAFYRDILPAEMIAARNLEARRTQWASSLANHDRVTLVGYDDDCTIVGFASALLLEPDASFASYLQTLYLIPEVTRAKLGTRLLRAMAGDLVQRGRHSMSLRVLRLNPARAFYEKYGARIVPEGIEHDAGTFDDVVYAFDNLRDLLRRLD
jgi:GNAT superfamily N-acetyltransferase